MTKATLHWTDVTTRIDGSVLSPAEIAAVDILDTFDGASVVIGSVLPGVQSFTTEALAVGDHAFTFVTRDTSGHSSARSNVAVATVSPTLADPSPGTDLTVVLNS